MERVYELTEKEKGKIVRLRWDGDTYYYNVFDSQEECDKEQSRLDKIHAEYKKERENYIKTLKESVQNGKNIDGFLE